MAFALRTLTRFPFYLFDHLYLRLHLHVHLHWHLFAFTSLSPQSQHSKNSKIRSDGSRQVWKSRSTLRSALPCNVQGWVVWLAESWKRSAKVGSAGLSKFGFRGWKFHANANLHCTVPWQFSPWCPGILPQHHHALRTKQGWSVWTWVWVWESTLTLAFP